MVVADDLRPSEIGGLYDQSAETVDSRRAQTVGYYEPEYQRIGCVRIDMRAHQHPLVHLRSKLDRRYTPYSRLDWRRDLGWNGMPTRQME